MTENEEYVTEAIRNWVWSGFHTCDDIDRMIEDIVEDDGEGDTAALKSLARLALRAKSDAEKSWPPMTDCDRLDQVFFGLHAAGICALANTGYTMSDGDADVVEVLAVAPEGHYRGFCFYHGQDIERALDGQGVMLAFGHIDDDPRGIVQVGQEVAEALGNAGFVVDWNGSIDTRINVPVFDWKRRAPAGQAPTAAVMVDRWLTLGEQT